MEVAHSANLRGSVALLHFLLCFFFFFVLLSILRCET